jgi:hypothetical protein
LQALLTEVRQLRQTLVVIQRLAVAQQHVDALSRQLDQVQQKLAQSAQESNALAAAVAANEAFWCSLASVSNHLAQASGSGSGTGVWPISV